MVEIVFVLNRKTTSTCNILGCVTHLLVASQKLDEDVIKALSKKVPQYLVFGEH